jgi:acyl carrier protein
MNDERIEDQIKKMIVERLFLDVEPSDIVDDDLIMEKYDIDSVRLFEMVIGVEELFGIVIDEDDFDIELFKNVKSVADYVKGKNSSA